MEQQTPGDTAACLGEAGLRHLAGLGAGPALRAIYIYVNLFLKAEKQLVPVRVVSPRGPLCCCTNVSRERQMVPPVPPVPAATGMAPAFGSAREQSSAQGWGHQEPTQGPVPCSAQLLCTNTAPQGSQAGCFLWHGTWQGSVCQKFHAVLRAREIFQCEAFPSLPPCLLLLLLGVVPKLARATAAPALPSLGCSMPWAWLGSLHPSIHPCLSQQPAQPAALLLPAPGASSEGAEPAPAGSLQGRAIPTRHHVSCASLEDILLPCMVSAGRVLQAPSMCCSWCLCCHLLQCHQPRPGGFSVSAGC